MVARLRAGTFIGLAFCLAIAIAVTTACRASPVRREPGLNVLLITIDTLRADAVGAYGNRAVSTPWLDRLSAGGVRFSDARAQSVVTLPSHANILSGRYPFRHGVRENSGFRFPADLDTLATLLKARGYRTGAFVSAFPLDVRFGLGRGFDVYDDRYGKGAERRAFREPERAGPATVAAAVAWINQQSTINNPQSNPQSHPQSAIRNPQYSSQTRSPTTTSPTSVWLRPMSSMPAVWPSASSLTAAADVR